MINIFFKLSSSLKSAGPENLSAVQRLDPSVVRLRFPPSQISQTAQFIHVLLGHLDWVLEDDVQHHFGKRRSCQGSLVGVVFGLSGRDQSREVQRWDLSRAGLDDLANVFADDVIEYFLRVRVTLRRLVHHYTPNCGGIFDFFTLIGCPFEDKVGLACIRLTLNQVFTSIVPALSPMTVEMVQDIVPLEKTSRQLPLATSCGSQTQSVSIIRHGPVRVRISFDAFQVELGKKHFVGIFFFDVNWGLTGTCDRHWKLFRPGKLAAVMPRIVETHDDFILGKIFQFFVELTILVRQQNNSIVFYFCDK